jgi:predicted transcriptional regulator
MGRNMGSKNKPLSNFERRKRAAPIVAALKKHKLSVTEAAKELGISKQAVSKHVNHNPEVIAGIKPMLDALFAAGATEEKYARVISEGMDAERTTGIKGKQITEPDHNARLKAGEQFAKLKKYISSDEDKVVNNKLIVIIGEKGLDEII